jgi:hypothetical protein
VSENDRPQDIGRRHRKSGDTAPETAAIIVRYRAAMRAELGALLDELEPRHLVQSSLDGSSDRAVGLGITARRERWDLAIRLGKELAGGSDEAPVTAETVATAARRRGTAAPRLTKRDRAALE